MVRSKKLFYFGLLFLLLITFSFAYSVKKTDGSTLSVKKFSYDGKAAYLDGKKVSPLDISEVSFIDTKEKKDKGKIVKEVEPFKVDEVVKMAKSALSLKEKGLKGIVVLDKGKFWWKKDGTRVYRYHFIGRILNETGKDWSRLVFAFEEDRARVKILLARTISPDGKNVYYLHKKEIKVTDKAGESQFFNNYKLLTAVLPKVSNDCIVEFIYERETFNPEDPKIFSASFFFQDYVPVWHSEVSVEFPADKEMYYLTRRFFDKKREKPQVSYSKDREYKIYTWALDKVPMIVPEYAMPPYSQVAPVVRCSPFKTWDYLYEYSRKLLKPKIKVTPEIKKKVEELTKGCKTIEEKIAKIYYFCQQEIRYISIKSSFSSGWAGHPAIHTFKNRYGDCIDKAILMATMLKVIGVKAYPVGLMTNSEGNMEIEIPIFNANHAINEVYLHGKRFFLDSTATTYRYPSFRADDQGVWASNEILGEFHKIPVDPPENNLYDQVKVIDLDSNGTAKVYYKNEFKGNQEANSRWYWLHVKESERKKVFENSINAISPGAKIVYYHFPKDIKDLTKPFSYEAMYELPNFANRAGNYLIFKIPGLEHNFSSNALPKRKYDLWFDTNSETKRTVVINLPPGYKASYLPPELDLSNEYVSYRAKYIPLEGQIIFTEDLKFKKRVVPAKDYLIFKNALDKVSSYSRKQIFLKKEGK